MTSKRNGPDATLKTISFIAAFFLNAGLGAAMAYASFQEEKPEEEAILIDMDNVVLEVPKYGEEKPKQNLPRIIELPTPEPAPQEAVKLNPEREEMPDPELEKKKLAEEEQRERDEEAKKEELERIKVEEAKKRKQAMDKALAQVNKRPDPRADEDMPAGYADGSQYGNSSNASANREQALYAAQVATAIGNELRVPHNVQDECGRLEARLAFKINGDGKLVGNVGVKQGSGNEFFDDAAIAAVRRFGSDTPLRIPLPKPELRDLRALVLKRGIEPIIKCRK